MNRNLKTLLMLCLLMTSPALADAVPQFNLTSFTGNVVPFLADFISMLFSSGIMSAFATVGTVLVLVLLVRRALACWARNSWQGFFIALAVGVVCTTTIQDIQYQKGAGFWAVKTAHEAWKDAYIKSSGYFGPKVATEISVKTATLAKSTSKFVQSAFMAYETVNVYTPDQIAGLKPEDLKKMSETPKDPNPAESGPMSQLLDALQVGYIGLMVLFSGFAGIIYGSAVGVILCTIALPISLAFLINGETRLLKLNLTTLAMCIATAFIAPAVSYSAVSLVFGVPITMLETQVTLANANIEDTVIQYQAALATCEADFEAKKKDASSIDIVQQGYIQFMRETCMTKTEWGTKFSSFITGMANMIMQMIYTVMGTLVALAIAGVMMRQVSPFLANLFSATSSAMPVGSPVGSMMAGANRAIASGQRVFQGMKRAEAGRAAARGNAERMSQQQQSESEKRDLRNLQTSALQQQMRMNQQRMNDMQYKGERTQNTTSRPANDPRTVDV